jgi:hypothetical protein
VAAGNAAERPDSASHHTVPMNHFNAVLAAGWPKSTVPPQERTDRDLIAADHGDDYTPADDVASIREPPCMPCHVFFFRLVLCRPRARRAA